MLAKAILVHGDIGYKFCWLLPSKDQNQGTLIGNEIKGYFDRRKSMERLQRESKWQVQALLQETRRLREENDVLRIQVSSLGPPHDQRPRG